MLKKVLKKGWSVRYTLGVAPSAHMNEFVFYHPLARLSCWKGNGLDIVVQVHFCRKFQNRNIILFTILPKTLFHKKKNFRKKMFFEKIHFPWWCCCCTVGDAGIWPNRIFVALLHRGWCCVHLQQLWQCLLFINFFSKKSYLRIS